MAKHKPVFSHKFDVGAAMSVPLNMPGGRNFFLRLLAWGLALILLTYAVLGRSFIGAYKEILISSIELDETNPDPEAVMAMMGHLGAIITPMLLMTLVLWIVFVMIETAMHKNVFRGTDNGMLPLRFGKDEARVMLAQFVLALCMVGVYFLVIIGIVLIFTLVAVSSQISSVLAIVLGIAAIFGTVYLFGLLIHVCLRWAPAAAMSVRDDKQYIFEGWRITKGRGWPLFGSYLVTGIIGYIVIYTVMTLGVMLAFGNMEFMLALSGLNVENPREVFDRMGDMLSSPRVKATLVFFTILYGVSVIVWYMCFWGIGNYAAQLDAKENGLM